MAKAKPLLDEEFADLMAAVGPFEKHPRLAVAVSGGPDSLALTFLAAGWAARRNGRVIGLTVDHGLRTASAGEARQTGDWLRARGIEHHILTWSGPKPATGLQQKARAVRYEHLGHWCRDRGVLHLLTAHHRQDQAETVALRMAKKSGPNGLAAMAAIRELPGHRLIRPLLAVDKERLIATLDHVGQNWIDDPSNQSRSFTRNRLRLEGIDVASLAAKASDHGRQREISEKRTNTLLARLVTIDPLGFASISACDFESLSLDRAENLLISILVAIGGYPYPPRGRSLKALANAMQGEREFRGATLAHCLIRQRRGQWLFCRERDQAPALALMPERWQRWEDRFLIRLRCRRQDVFVQSLGDRGWTKRERLVQIGRRREIPPFIRASLPSIWEDETLIAIPHLGLFDGSHDPWALDLKFRPRTPLANAPFTAHM